MSAQSFLAKLGLRTATLGSLASLALAFPLAEGSMDPAAHTDATRIGVFAARGGTPEVGVVVNGTQSLSVRQTGVVVTGSVNASGTVTSTGAVLTPVAANPGGSTTIWVDSAGNILKFGANPMIAVGGAGAVQFATGAGGVNGDAATFFWDDTQKALAIGGGTASARLDVTGLDLSAAADGAIDSIYAHSTALAKNDTNTRQFYGTRLRPTFNTGASNANTTYDVLSIDTVNGTTTGLTTNLISLNYGGVNRFKIDGAGVTTIVGVPYTWPGSQGAANSILQNNGSGVLSWNVMSGDATLNGSGVFTLATTIVAGGPTGSGTVVPVITYDAKGRLTAVTTANITAAGIGAIGGSIAANQIAYGLGTNTIQGSATFLNVSGQITIGTATPDATAALTIVGTTLNTQATGSIGAVTTSTTLSKNDTNTRTFYGSLFKPTLNTGGANTNTTFNILAVDTTNIGVTGLTTNLINLAYAGTSQFSIKSDASITSPHFVIDETNSRILIGTQSYGLANTGSIAIQPIGQVSNNLQAGASVLIGTGGANSITSGGGNSLLLGVNNCTISNVNTILLGQNASNTHNGAIVIGRGSGGQLTSQGNNIITMGNNAGTAGTLHILDGLGVSGGGRVGINSITAVASLHVTGQTLLTAATGTVSSLFAGGNITKNDANTAVYRDARINTTLNSGASNTNTTVNVLSVDTTNTSLTGLTVNLLDLNFGGSNVATVSSTGLATFNGGINTSGIVTLSRNGAGTSDHTLGVTGTPVANATSSQIRIGNALVGGNAAANGGTYIGVNLPSTGAGSTADIEHFQVNGVSAFKIGSNAQVRINNPTDDPGVGAAQLSVNNTGSVGSAPCLFVDNGNDTTAASNAILVRTKGNVGASRVFVVRNLDHPTQFSFIIGSLGAMAWGTGDGARDVGLSRSTTVANALVTDGQGNPGNFLVSGRLGVNTGSLSSTNAVISVTPYNITTDADSATSVMTFSGTVLSKNDTNIRQFYALRFLPTFNTGASNTATTYNVINVDTVNTSVTGLTYNLLSLSSGGTAAVLVEGNTRNTRFNGAGNDPNGAAQVSVATSSGGGPVMYLDGSANNSGVLILKSQGITGGASVFSVRNSAHTTSFTFNIGSLGNMSWGTGDAVRDTFLTRSGVATLTIDDNAGGPGNLIVTSKVAFGSTALNATATAGITGATLSTAADLSVGSIATGATVTKNDANTRTFYDTLIKPTFNTGGSNTTTTYNVLAVDTVNTAVTGLTVNLLSLNSGGTNVAKVDSTGVMTLPRDGSGAGNYTFGLTGRPNQSSSSSLFRLGNPIVGGNNLTNGGTYIGISTPGSLGGSAADFINFQKNGSSVFNVTVDGLTGIGSAASASTALLLPASTTAISSLRAPHGTAPTAPVNGDIWTTSTAMFVQINGATVQLGSGGGGITGSGTLNQITIWSGASSVTGTTHFFVDNDGSNYSQVTFYDPSYTESLVSVANTASQFKGFCMRNSDQTKRWQIFADGSEGGGNSGSSLCIRRYSDAGALIDQPLKITRNSNTATWTGVKNIFPASTTSLASLNIPHGSAPTSPANGDVWTTTTAMFVQINGSTVQLGSGTIAGSIAANQIAYGSGTNAIQGSANFTYNSSVVALSGTYGSAANALSISSVNSGAGEVRSLNITTDTSGSTTGGNIIGGVIVATNQSGSGTSNTVVGLDISAKAINGSTSVYGLKISPQANGSLGAVPLLVCLQISPGTLTGATTKYGILQQGATLTNAYEGLNWFELTPQASQSALLATGTWFTGGTTTTTKPLFLLEPAGTTSTAWNTNGTGLGINAASGYTGNIVDLQLSGTTKFSVDASGNTAVGGATLSTSTALITPASTTSRSSLRVPHGSAPTAPVNGDIWTTTTAMFVQINGSTVQLGASSPGGSTTQIQYNNAGAFGGIAGFTYTPAGASTFDLNMSRTYTGQPTGTNKYGTLNSTLSVTPTTSASGGQGYALRSAISIDNVTGLASTNGTLYATESSITDASIVGGSWLGTIAALRVTCDIATGSPILGSFAATGGAHNTFGLNVAVSKAYTGAATTYAGISSQVTLNATGTVTNAYGYRMTGIAAASGAITNSYGVYIDTVTGTGITTGYGVYQVDTGALNFFGGVLAVGGATPSTTTALITPASTTGVSSLRIPHGSAPTSPVNGDIWTTSTAMFVRINGTTVQLGSGGGTIGGSITQSQVAFGAVTGNQIAGSSNFTWDTGSNALFIQAPGFTASSGIARINGTFTGSAGNHYMSGLTVTLDNAQTGGSNNSIDGILTNVTCTGSGTTNNGVNGFRTIVSLPTGQNTGQVTLFNGSLTTSTGSTYTTVYGSSLTGSIDGTITNFLGRELAATIIGTISTAAVSYSDNLNTSGTGITVPIMRGFSSTAVVANTDTATEFTGFYTNAQLAGSATNFYGAYLSPTVGFTGSATNLYGVYVAPINNGAVTNLFGIYQAGANVINQFEGTLFSTVSPIGGTQNAAWFSGAWFSGGDSTTTRPLVLIEPSGTTSSNWNTGGTALGINAAVTFAGNLLDLQVNGNSYLRVDQLGTAIISGLADARVGDVSSSWTDGGSQVIQDNSWSIINTNSGTLSSFSLFMPANSIDGKVCTIVTAGDVVSFSLDGNGHSINNAPGSLLANTSVSFEFFGGIWYRLY